MEVTVFAQPSHCKETLLHNKTVIVIDVLRATSSITAAIENGAAQVIPARDPGEAMAIYGRLGRGDSLLGGERGGIRLPDFDLGNSPLEYDARVRGKSVIMTTTNGTQAILAARNAAEVLIGCMRNRTAVARRAVASGNDILLLCAGTEGMLSADDICCAGAIVDAVSRCAPEGAGYNDLARISCLVYASWREGRAELGETRHYSRLRALGFEEDLRYCFAPDASQTVPCYRNGVIA